MKLIWILKDLILIFLGFFWIIILLWILIITIITIWVNFIHKITLLKNKIIQIFFSLIAFKI
jgi:hypothetical protein